jgi:hypothetical protein
MKAPAGREGSWVGWQRSDLVWGFYPFIFSRALLSLYANQVCRKQHSGWLCLQCSDWLCPNHYTLLILIYPSFHPLRSQGGHNGDFQGPFCLSSSIIHSSPNVEMATLHPWVHKQNEAYIHLYTTECCLVLKRKGILPQATTWMNLEETMLSVTKDKHHMTPLMETPSEHNYREGE